jgi:tRNA (guanine37-N1)-methyltransferase
MLALKVPLKDAEEVKRELLEKGLMLVGFHTIKEDGFMYFPIKKRLKTKYSYAQMVFAQKKEQGSMKESLSKVLSKEEMELLKTSMDIIGSIAIIEIPYELESREKVIAEEALNASKVVKTVLKKGKHGGEFRTQDLILLAGVDTKEASYRENGVTLKVDVEKVYFSPRLSNERKRIVQLVKKGEDVLIIGSGAGPYTCVLAKNTGAHKVVGVEVNPEGHKYAEENVKLNKLKNVENYCGDAAEVVPNLKMKFDRIIMPMPHNADEYLEAAINAAKKDATIHFYDFELESEVDKGVEKFRKAAEKAKRKFKLVEAVKTGMPGPRKYRYSYDFKLM